MKQKELKEIKVSQLIGLLKKLPSTMPVTPAVIERVIKDGAIAVGSMVIAKYDDKINAIGIYKGINKDGKHVVEFQGKNVERDACIPCPVDCAALQQTE